jgi:glycosyltransferase involved in cell wall biosynthesis
VNATNNSQTVAVVIPAYNASQLVGEAIQSALTQGPAVAEIVVVDDGSQDGTSDVVRAITDPRVRLIAQSNAGPAAARNRGWRASQSPWVAFVDADDALAPGAVNALLGAAKGRQRIPYGSEEIFGPTFAAGACHRADLASHSGSLLKDIAINYRGTIFSALFPRACLEAINGFDESVTYGEDFDFALRLAKQFEFVHVPIPVYRARMHDSNRHRHFPASALAAYVTTVERVLPASQAPALVRRRARAHWLWTLAGALRADGQQTEARATYWRSICAWPLKIDAWRQYLQG